MFYCALRCVHSSFAIISIGKVVLLLWIFYVFVLSCACYVFVRVCLYVLCGHLLIKGWPLGSRLWCLLWVCHFPIGILGQVWYLIVSIPDLCTFTYSGCFALLFFLVSRDLCVALPYDTTDLSTVCDCGICWSYSFTVFIVKYNIDLKTLLQQRIWEPVFYGDLVYKFKRIDGKPNFSDQTKKQSNVIKSWI